MVAGSGAGVVVVVIILVHSHGTRHYTQIAREGGIIIKFSGRCRRGYRGCAREVQTPSKQIANK